MARAVHQKTIFEINYIKFIKLLGLTKVDNYEAVEKTLKEDPELVNYSKDGITLLHIAAKKGFLETVKVLVENGAEIDALDDDEDTPIHKAVLGNHIEIIKLLIKKGASVDLYHVKNVEVLRLLMNAGAEIDEDICSKRIYNENPKFKAIIDQALQAKNALENSSESSSHPLASNDVHEIGAAAETNY